MENDYGLKNFFIVRTSDAKGHQTITFVVNHLFSFRVC